MDVRIDWLADFPGAVPVLVEWFEREWAPYSGPGGPGCAERDPAGSMNRHALPITSVAHVDGALCGTAALKAESVTPRAHLIPWLTALPVAPEFRRRGIAERLIAAAEYVARGMGVARVYAGSGLGPGTAETPLRKRGRVLIETTPYFASDIAIYAKNSTIPE